MCFKILLVPKIVAYFRCLFFIMSVHSHICTYSTYILNTYIHNDLWQCICVLMICFLAKKIITLYPVRVRISLKKTQPGRRPGCIFFFWNLPFGQVSFFFSETCLRRGCVFFGRFLSRFRFLSEVSFLIYSRIRMLIRPYMIIFFHPIYKPICFYSNPNCYLAP